ncbi:hypothetical protein ACN4EK_06390 [Pantanalinema rosaneae CENA516]|uniref:hypothetical protein n=1 Tax=Pantanalinema rosaneae TaxID=1620701 RepID=UPI003D700491
MLKIMMLLLITVSLSYYFSSVVAPATIVPLLAAKETMTANSPAIAIQRVNLLAREEKHSLDGVAPNPHRPIGFATVCLEINNPTKQDVAVVIQSIEIRTTTQNIRQTFQLATDTIHPLPAVIQLTPLAHAEVMVHLTNQVGYPTADRVQAVVTYRSGEQSQTVMSEPTPVQRY